MPAAEREGRCHDVCAIWLRLGVADAAALSGATAHADIRNWSFYKGAAVVKEHHQPEGDGMVGVFDVEVRRTMTGANRRT